MAETAVKGEPVASKGAQPLFQAVQREETLVSRVTNQLESLIVSNQLHPGDRIPAERDLANQFAVSRTVVREAVRSLVAKGLLEVHPGSRTLVRTPSAESISQSLQLFLRGNQPNLDHKKVLEVRRLLEVEIAGLAADRRTENDLEKMQAILDSTDGIDRDRNQFVQWDIDFHMALATATHNELFPLILESVVGVLIKVRELGFDVPGTPRKAHRYHSAIFEQVKLGKAKGARQAMLDHMNEAEQTVQRALELRNRLQPSTKST